MLLLRLVSQLSASQSVSQSVMFEIPSINQSMHQLVALRCCRPLAI